MSSYAVEIFACGQSQMTKQQVAALLDYRASADFKTCWLKALMTFVKSGNIYQAAITFLECMVGTGKLDIEGEAAAEAAITLVARAEASPFDYAKCVVNLILAIIAGQDIVSAVINFVLCLIGQDGELEDPVYRDVNRCG